MRFFQSHLIQQKKKRESSILMERVNTLLIDAKGVFDITFTR